MIEFRSVLCERPVPSLSLLKMIVWWAFACSTASERTKTVGSVVNWMWRESELREYATISCGVARTIAAARPSSRPVAASSFVSEYMINSECSSCFVPAELASNTANMSAPFVSNSASGKL